MCVYDEYLPLLPFYHSVEIINFDTTNQTNWNSVLPCQYILLFANGKQTHTHTFQLHIFRWIIKFIITVLPSMGGGSFKWLLYSYTYECVSGQCQAVEDRFCRYLVYFLDENKIKITVAMEFSVSDKNLFRRHQKWW